MRSSAFLFTGACTQSRLLTANGTRPWKIFGEGPTPVLTGGFTDKKQKSFTAEDIRFTTKGRILYAIALDWPGKTMIVKSLGAAAKMPDKRIASVKLLGSRQRLRWKQEPDGLKVELPEIRPCNYAFVLRIETN